LQKVGHLGFFSRKSKGQLWGKAAAYLDENWLEDHFAQRLL
jgi:hypothetical protein